MPWIPIKNFGEDVNKDSKVLAVGLKCTVIFTSKNCLIVLNEKGEDYALSKDFVSHVWREPKRWRAENGERYCFLEAGIRPGISIREANEAYLPVNSADYECGNYFKPGFLKAKHIQAFKDLLAKFHEEEE